MAYYGYRICTCKGELVLLYDIWESVSSVSKPADDVLPLLSLLNDLWINAIINIFIILENHGHSSVGEGINRAFVFLKNDLKPLIFDKYMFVSPRFLYEQPREKMHGFYKFYKCACNVNYLFCCRSFCSTKSWAWRFIRVSNWCWTAGSSLELWSSSSRRSLIDFNSSAIWSKRSYGNIPNLLYRHKSVVFSVTTIKILTWNKYIQYLYSNILLIWYRYLFEFLSTKKATKKYPRKKLKY